MEEEFLSEIASKSLDEKSDVNTKVKNYVLFKKAGVLGKSAVLAIESIDNKALELSNLIDNISIEWMKFEKNLGKHKDQIQVSLDDAPNWIIFQEKLDLLVNNKPTISEKDLILKLYDRG